MRDYRVVRASLLPAILQFLLVNSASGWEISNPWPLAGNIASVSSPSQDTCWIADDYGGIAVTTDGGDSWRPVSLPSFWWGPHYLAFQTGRSGWAAEPSRSQLGAGHCYQTTDGGASWREFQLGTDDDLFNLTCLAVEGETVIIGGYDLSNVAPAIYRRAGDEFIETLLPESEGMLLDVSILNGRSVWVVGEQGYFTFSPNGGASWQQAETGVNTTLSAVGFTSNQVGWVGGGNFNTPVLLKTNNGGGSWTQVEGLEATSEIVGLAPYQGDGMAAISKGGGQDDVAAILVTRDGASWERVSGVTGELYSAIGATGNEIWVGGQKGLLMNSPDGRNVAPTGHRVTTAQLTDVSFCSSTIGWAVGEGATVLKTSAGGENWSLAENFPGWNVIRVVAISADKVIVSCADSREYISEDGGENWREIAISDLDVYIIKRFGANLIAASGGSLLFSTDDGENWIAKRVSALTVTDFTMAGENILVALNNGPVMMSSDNGDNWERAAGIPENCEKIFHFDVLHGWALSLIEMELRLLITQNGWETYSSVRSLQSFYDWVIVSETEGWIAGSFVSGDMTREGLWHMTERGLQRELLDLPVGRVTGIASTDPNHVWICGAAGLLARLTEGAGGVSEDHPSPPLSISLMHAYPNPTNGRVTLSWNANLPAPLPLDLIGADGRNGKSYIMPMGSSHFGVELGDLPAGTYYLRAHALSDQPIPIVLVK